MVDPEFRRWGTNLIFGKIFAENCMTMKEMDQEGARIPIPHPPYPLGAEYSTTPPRANINTYLISVGLPGLWNTW